MAKKDKEPHPITVRFKTTLEPDGTVNCVSVVQGEQAVNLTRAQAVSLADQINARLRTKADG